MTNIAQLMKQAQEMQTKMMEMQKKLEAFIVEGTSGGGMVRVTATCKGEVKTLKVDPSLLNPNDIEILEDLIVAALNDARVKGEEKTQQEMGQITGGISLPEGLKLPF